MHRTFAEYTQQYPMSSFGSTVRSFDGRDESGNPVRVANSYCIRPAVDFGPPLPDDNVSTQLGLRVYADGWCQRTDVVAVLVNLGSTSDTHGALIARITEAITCDAFYHFIMGAGPAVSWNAH